MQVTAIFLDLTRKFGKKTCLHIGIYVCCIMYIHIYDCIYIYCCRYVIIYMCLTMSFIFANYEFLLGRGCVRL